MERRIGVFDKVPKQDIAEMTVKPATEFDSTSVTCIVRQHQLRLYGLRATFPKFDPSDCVVSIGDTH